MEVEENKELKILKKSPSNYIKELEENELFCYSCGDIYIKFDLFEIFNLMDATTYLKTLKIPIHEKICKKCLQKLTKFWRCYHEK